MAPRVGATFLRVLGGQPPGLMRGSPCQAGQPQCSGQVHVHMPLTRHVLGDAVSSSSHVGSLGGPVPRIADSSPQPCHQVKILKGMKLGMRPTFNGPTTTPTHSVRGSREPLRLLRVAGERALKMPAHYARAFEETTLTSVRRGEAHSTTNAEPLPSASLLHEPFP